MVAARGARGPHRGHVSLPVRARPRRLRLARAAPPTTSPRSQTAGSRSSRRGRPSTRIRRSRISSARSSRSPRRRRPQLDGAVRFFEGAGARGTLELVGEEVLALIRSGTPPEQIALVAPSLDGWRAPLETVLGALGVPYAVESRARLGVDAVRARAAAAPSLRVGSTAGAASCSRFSARRTRASPARPSISSKAGCAVARSVARARRGRGREASRGADPAARRAARPASRRRGVRALVRSMVRSAYGTEAPPAGETSRLDLRAYDAALRLLDELDGLAALGGEAAPEDVLGRARARRGAARRRPARPGGSRCSTCCARARAGSRSSSSSGSRRARCRAVSASRRSSTTTPPRARRAARAARSGQPRPLPLLYGLHARDASALSRPRGGDRRRRPARAEPVLGGGRRGLRPGRRRACDGAAPALGADVAARRCADRPRAAARARALVASDADAARAIAEANGWERRLARARTAFDRRDQADESRRARLAPRQDDVRCHRARAVRRLLVGVALRADRLAEDDRRRGRPDAARLGRPPARCTSSTRGCRRSSGTIASRRRTSSRPSASCAAASTTRCAAACGST